MKNKNLMSESKKELILIEVKIENIKNKLNKDYSQNIKACINLNSKLFDLETEYTKKHKIIYN